MPKQNKKTCWSVVKNAFSFLSSREFILGYLCISSMLLKASANESTTAVYFTKGMKKSHLAPADLCIHAAPPNSKLGVRSIFSNGVRTGVEVSQLDSDDPDFNQHIDTWSLEEQMIRDRYYGTSFCNGVLENKDRASYPIHECNVGNTDYSVDFAKEDIVTINFKPR